MFTPHATALFLADLLDIPRAGSWRLLDPGAGVGSLTAAVVHRTIREAPQTRLHVTVFEIDQRLLPALTATLNDCARSADAAGMELSFEILPDDFISWATASVNRGISRFDACIMNPPYRKVGASAPERAACERVGLRASNLYTQFLGLGADLLTPGGSLSAIVPRSFANGPYHEPFRRYFLERVSLELLHVYETRGRVFADSQVLQENVVLKASRASQSGFVTLSTSLDADEPRRERKVPFGEVVRPEDPHRYIRIPSADRDTAVAEAVASFPSTLGDLGVGVSTGRVVDFRTRENLRKLPDEETVPLIYPGHLRSGGVTWPMPDGKKPNALARNDQTEQLLLPNETYVLVKRFSAKEERRRLVAAISSPAFAPGTAIGIENHLNVLHCAHRGLPIHLALGLCAVLNSTTMDLYVRTFSGHTQINATDLRQLRFPRGPELCALGESLLQRRWPEQDELDHLVGEWIPSLRVAEPRQSFVA